MAVRRQLFDELGQFDTRLRVNYGDTEFCVRAQRAGYRNLYAGHVRLLHHESRTRNAKAEHIDDYRMAASLLEPWRTREPDPHYPSELSRLAVVPRSRRVPAEFGQWLR